MPQTATIAGHLSMLIQARLTCQENGNTEWYINHTDAISAIAREHLPSGSGIDSGTSVDLDASRPERLVLRAPFHVMHETGYYTSWQDYLVIVTPSFMGPSISIKGRDHNGLKDYLHEVFHDAMSRVIER